MGLGNEITIVQFIADILSVITISTCFILKIPRILNILKVKNANGINLVGLLMELLSYTILFSYNFRNGYAVISYLEYPILLILECFLIFLAMYYKSCLNVYSFICMIIYLLIAGALILEIVPLGVIALLVVPFCTPIGVSSKVVQLLHILRTKNSESVNILTWFISAFTNFSRVFTVSVGSGDLFLQLNFTVNMILSSSVMIVAYMCKPPKSRKD